MKKDEALKLALDALYIVNPNEFSQADPEGKIDKAIIAIKEALAQPEPDDFMLRDVLASELKCWHRLTGEEAQNLIDFIKHTSPPQRKQPAQIEPDDVTDEMLKTLWGDQFIRTNLGDRTNLANAVNAWLKHGGLSK